MTLFKPGRLVCQGSETFVSPCSTRSYERRNPKGHSQPFGSLVWLWI